jgi:hypothetical protein
MELPMPMTIETELIGLPSGQVLGVYSAFIPTLYAYGFILFDPKLDTWTFKDENEANIKVILRRRDLCLM